MAKPRLIILIRHAQSEGNKSREIHQTTPDHRVKLTSDGWAQAHEAGRRLRKLLRPDDTLHFFTSPYRRTRETAEGILTTLTSDEDEPSPFRRSDIKVYEEPRLREQDFGNFQPCSAEMERMWQERADYGHFFYRIPNGESAADAYDRISGFNESLWRQFGEDDFASVCVLVTHGLMSRVFLMKWYHFTVEEFEDLRNVNHCEFLIMRKQDSGKYILENKLRTWSDLRRERALKEGKDHDDFKLERNKTFVATRRWGGCPDGCNHSSHYKKREDLELLRQRDVEHSVRGTNGASADAVHTTTTTSTTITTATPRKHHVHHVASSDGDDEDEQDHEENEDTKDHILEMSSAQNNANKENQARLHPKSVRYHDHLHVGRDFGGTYSGHASTAGSDTDASEEEHHRHRRLASLDARLQRVTTASALRRQTNGSEHSSDSEHDAVRPAYMSRLGDGVEDDDLDRAEKEDRSIQGSVY